MGIAFKLGECGNKIQLQFMMKMIELSNVYIIEGFKMTSLAKATTRNLRTCLIFNKSFVASFYRPLGLNQMI